MTADALPVSGAWMPGDPPGRRQFFTFATDRRFALEGGATLRDVTVAYETWGTLNADRSNAVLVCHAWTGDSHAAGPAGRGHPTPGWWEPIVGPGPRDRHRPLVRRVPQRARRVSGLDRPGVTASRRRPALRVAASR